VPGAYITEWQGDSSIQELTADSLGNFKIQKTNKSDSITVSGAFAESFTSFTSAKLDIDKSPVSVYLDDVRGADELAGYISLLRGVVIDSKSKRLLDDVSVSISDYSSITSVGRFFLQSNSTDTTVLISKAGYLPRNIPLTGTKVLVELELNPSLRKITGYLMQKDDKPLDWDFKQGSIEIVDDATMSSATSNRDGRFEIYATPSGTLSIKDPDKIYLPLTVEVKSLLSKTANPELVVDPKLSKVSGKIFTAKGVGLCGITVKDQTRDYQASTDQNGKFEMYATSSGTLNITDPHEIYKPKSVKVSNLSAEGTVLARSVSPSKKYDLLVKIIGDDGLPLPGINVVIEGTTVGTVSDPCGVAVLKTVDSKQYVQFSFVGFKPKKIKMSEMPNEVVLEQER
jgi:hypothetical protein